MDRRSGSGLGAGVVGMLVSAVTPAATLTLSPTDDAFAHQTEPAANFGSLAGLASGFAFPGTDSWITYLRFDLGSIPTDEIITGVTLNMFQFLGGGFVPIGTHVYRVANDNWTEGGVTFNNRPDGGSLGTQLGSSSDGGDHRGWTSWDLLATGLWDPATDRADGHLSVSVFETLGGTQSHNWCSRESDLSNCLISGETAPVAALRQPFLEVTTVPAPGAAWLMATGFIALVPRLRRYRNV